MESQEEMIEAKYRGLYQKICIQPIIPFARRFSPASITVFGLISGLVVPLLCLLGRPWIALFFLTLSGFLDTLDGSIARKEGKSSAFGSALDITSDRLVEWAAILGIFLIAPNERGLLCLLMLGSTLFCVTTFLVAGIFSENSSEKSFHYSPGVMERAEAFLFFGAILLFPSAFHLLAILFTFLLFLTGLIRLRQLSV